MTRTRRSTRWLARVRVAPQVLRVATFATRVDAERWIVGEMRALLADGWSFDMPPPLERMTVLRRAGRRIPLRPRAGIPTYSGVRFVD